MKYTSDLRVHLATKKKPAGTLPRVRYVPAKRRARPPESGEIGYKM